MKYGIQLKHMTVKKADKKIKALITGVAGFIGSHLAERLLREGNIVVGVDKLSPYYDPGLKWERVKKLSEYKGFCFLKKDISRGLDIKDIDCVFHLAAQPGVRKSWEDFEDYINDNINATRSLLELFKNTKVNKFIFASSSSVYGNGPLPMRENQPLEPISPYGVTKMAAEKIGLAYCRAFGIPLIVLRFFTVYGPGQRPDMMLHRFISKILRGEQIEIYGDGNQKRDFTYVDDIVEGIIKTACIGEVGEIYNLGGGNSVSLNEVVGILRNIIQKEICIKYVDAAKGDAKCTQADMNKAREGLRFRSKVKIGEGIKKQYEWMAGLT